MRRLCDLPVGCDFLCEYRFRVREILAITTPYFEGIYPIPIGVEGIHEVHVDAASRLQTKNLFSLLQAPPGVN